MTTVLEEFDGNDTYRDDGLNTEKSFGFEDVDTWIFTLNYHMEYISLWIHIQLQTASVFSMTKEHKRVIHKQRQNLNE